MPTGGDRLDTEDSGSLHGSVAFITWGNSEVHFCEVVVRPEGVCTHEVIPWTWGDPGVLMKRGAVMLYCRVLYNEEGIQRRPTMMKTQSHHYSSSLPLPPELWRLPLGMCSLSLSCQVSGEPAQQILRASAPFALT